MKGTSNRRAFIVMGATMAAVVGVDLAIGTTHPMRALLLTVVILIISSVALPSRAWVKFSDGCRQIAQALGWRGVKQLRLTRTAVILILAVVTYLAVDLPVFGTSIPAGLAGLAAILTVASLAIWRPGRRIQRWRQERTEEQRLSRQLTKMDAHDRENFSGKGIPRKDWAAFNDELARVLREMRASEEPGK